MGEIILAAENISKHYTDKVGYTINLLKDVNLHVGPNEFVTILAPKGSGKSSLLKICAGIDESTNGIIRTNLAILPLIPTEPSSFPWLSVVENVRFKSNLKDDEIQSIIDAVGLHGYENHYPHSKSEGFRFRISLARALAIEPKLIIIDEPFNNCKADTKKEVYILLRQIQTKFNISILFGTTNISEAIFLSDRIYLMKKNPGEIVEETEVTLPVERRVSDFNSADFLAKRTAIENTFKEKTDQTFYNFSI